MRRVVSDVGRATWVSDVLKAVAHPVRLGIVAVLCEGEANVGTLARLLRQPPAIVSQQLRILRMHHLVAAERRGGRSIYSLLEPQLRQLVSCMEHCAGPLERRPGGRP